MRDYFEDRCAQLMQARRDSGEAMYGDDGSPVTRESLCWKHEDGSYGVLMLNAAWMGYRWGREAANAHAQK